jgi:dCMP deaminase
MTNEIYQHSDTHSDQSLGEVVSILKPASALETWLRMAIDFSKRSPAPDKQVGVIAVDQKGVLLGYGWNYSVDENDPSTVDEFGRTRDTTLHAEDELMARAMESGKSLEGATLYITHSPCMRCAARLKRAKVARVYFLEEFKNGAGNDFLTDHGVEVVQVVDVDPEFDERRAQAEALERDQEDTEDHYDFINGMGEAPDLVPALSEADTIAWR